MDSVEIKKTIASLQDFITTQPDLPAKDRAHHEGRIVELQQKLEECVAPVTHCLALTRDSAFWETAEAWLMLKFQLNWPHAEQVIFLQEKLQQLKNDNADEADIRQWEEVYERFT